MLRRVSALAILLVSLAVLLGVESTEHSNIRRAAVHPNAYGYPADQVVFAQAKPKRVAIVGAGASGSAAAFFLRRAARVAEKRAGVESGELLGEIVVYEQEDYVGGRSTVVYPYDDESLKPIELGASIFVDANVNLVKAAKLFNLSVVDPGFAESGIGIWDGEKFLFTTTVTKSRWSGWWDTVAALKRYGPLSPYRQGKAVGALVKKFANVYDPAWLAQRGTVNSIEEFASTMDIGVDMTTQSGSEWARNSVKVGDRWINEIMEASTRVNYAADMDQIHALGAAVSLSAAGASSIKGGNYQIFKNMLVNSDAKVHLGAQVSKIELGEGGFRVTANDSTADFDQVFFAAPWHLSPISKSLEEHFEHPIPKQQYVKLHVTLLTTTAPSPDPSFFKQTPNFEVPTTILTTSTTSKETGTPAPGFQSLTYHGETLPNSGEWVVKIFSMEEMDDYTLNTIFGSRPTWVHRKVWRSYPALRPIAAFAPVQPIEGLHYLAAMEPWISTMETQTLSAREAVARVVQKWWGIGLGECRTGDSWDLTCE